MIEIPAGQVSEGWLWGNVCSSVLTFARQQGISTLQIESSTLEGG